MSNLKAMMDQVKKLQNVKGVQNILDEASEILGNPILMHDTEYILQAKTKVVTDDPIWNEIAANGTFSKKTQNFFMEEGFVEDVANASRVALLKSDKLKYDRYAGKLFNKNNSYVSNLVAVACNKPFEENDKVIFEITCKLLSREISKNRSYQEYEQSHQETLIRNLINGDYDKNLDVAQVEILYNSLGSNLYLAVADISQCSKNNTFKSLLQQKNPEYKYALYSGYVVIIISTADAVLNVNNELKEFVSFFEQNNIYAGLSSSFENLFELRKYYKEALESLNCLLQNKCNQRIFPYNRESIEILQQIKALPNGKGIQYLLNKGIEILGNPLLFHDMELNLLGYTENVEIRDPIWEELIAYGTSSDETIKLFETEGFINTMENTKGGSFLVSEKIKYDRISWRIYNADKIMIGCLSIVNTDKQFSEDELVLFGTFSQKFSDEIHKIKFYNNYGQIYSRTVINGLISGNIDDYAFYSVDIGNLYNNLMSNLYFVVIDTAQSDSEHISLKYFRDLFNWPGTVNRYAIYSSYIVIIISNENSPLNGAKELGEVSRIFEERNIYAGVSSCFENIYDLQKYYTEATEALNLGLKNKNNKQRIFMYDKGRHSS